jgi:MYXO-CTERM domain-containing protein
MLGAESNPLGGGQAYVMDDFSLTVVPEPGTALLGLAGLTLVARRRRA